MSNPFAKGNDGKGIKSNGDSVATTDSEYPDERKGGLVTKQALPFILKSTLRYNKHVRQEILTMATEVVSEEKVEFDKKLNFLYERYMEMSAWKDKFKSESDGKRKADVESPDEQSPPKSPRVQSPDQCDDQGTPTLDKNFELQSAALEQRHLELLLRKQELENKKLLMDIQKLEKLAEDESKQGPAPNTEEAVRGQVPKPRGGGQQQKPRGAPAQRCAGMRK